MSAIKIALLHILLAMAFHATAQTYISGRVTGIQGEALVGANVYIDQSIEGSVTDAEGRFGFSTSLNGNQTLVVSLIGYETKRTSFACQAKVELMVSLRESVTTLNAVSITAGNYEASDKKRTAVMSPLDVYSTSGSVGDVTGAFRTLPGSQVAPDDGRLLVRGGEAYETKTYMDGLLIGNPYNSKVPDLPTRGRFAPNLFSGTAFNTGGYSSEYGQALSSVMLLSSTDLELEPSTSFSLMSLGSELSQTWTTRTQSLEAGIGYYNMSAQHSLFQSRMNWTKPTESGNGHLIYRKQTDKGLLKAFVSGGKDHMSFEIPHQGQTTPMKVANQAGNLYSNISYRHSLSDKVSYQTGVALSTDRTEMNVDTMAIDTRETVIDMRLKVVADLHPQWKLITGVGNQTDLYRQDYQASPLNSVWHGNVNSHVVSQFVETEYHPIAKLALRVGLRGEYLSLGSGYHLSPRLSLAYQTSKSSQLSLAYGRFLQTPENDYLKFNPLLKPQTAQHFIASFQAGDAGSRLLRAEAYLKSYDKLVRVNPQAKTLPNGYSTTGNGYAKGIDLFFRDKTSVKNGEFWLSYSYIDTKRLYGEFPIKATPSFIAQHTVNVVSKYYIKQLTSQIGATYTLASGKTYHHPDKPGFMNSYTPNYADLSLSWSYLTQLKGNFTVFYVSVSNVGGRSNIYGYRSVQSANTSQQSLVAIGPDQKRFVFVGMFINLF